MRQPNTKRARKQGVKDQENQNEYFTTKDIQLKLEQNQKQIINFFIDNQISILTADPGCGKTTLALYFSIKQLLNKEFEKIIITKPIIETGKSIGFLPGELEEKINPYKQSYIDAIVKIVGKSKTADLFRTNKIVFENIGFVRGKTFENACIILDEVQNLELSSIVSFVTRIHETSKMIILGDEYQADIKNSGLKNFISICKNVKGIDHKELDESFQMRSKILVDLYRNYKQFLNK